MKPEVLYAEMSGKDLRGLILRTFGEAALIGSLDALDGEPRNALNRLISDYLGLSPELLIAIVASGPKAGGSLFALTLTAILVGAALHKEVVKKESETQTVVE